MPAYRRNRVSGGTCVFTVTLRNRHSTLLTAPIDQLRAAVRTARSRQPFHIDAWVVLHEHMHCRWTLRADDSDYPARWQAIKITFSTSVPAIIPHSPTMIRRRDRGIWQHRYWEHTIRDEGDYAAHMDDIHFNPVKARARGDSFGVAVLDVPRVRLKGPLPRRLDRSRSRKPCGRRTPLSCVGGLRAPYEGVRATLAGPRPSCTRSRAAMTGIFRKAA
jgi:putative transposase